MTRTVSLFTGGGGLDIGVERAGATVVAHAEVHDYASRILAHRFPDVPNLGDVTTIDWTPYAGTIDLIVGGFPCQDISLAGLGAGLDGERSGLWREYLRAIVELEPRAVLIENVAALRTRGIDRVLRDLSRAGYDAEWDTISAAALGAPHLRERMFIIAWQRGTCAHAPWPTPPLADAWREEPAGMERLTSGVPNRVGRLFVLGNAVVPQVGEYVARILLDRLEAGPPADTAPAMQPFAYLAGDAWEAPGMDLFGESEVLSTFPAAGMMRGDQVAERQRVAPQSWAKDRALANMAPTLVQSNARRPTDGMLPTPTASEPGLSQTPEVWDARQQRQLAKGNAAFTDTLGIAMQREPRLLPTPRVIDSEQRGNPKGMTGTLASEARNLSRRLLATPKASDGEFAFPRTTGRPPDRATFLATQLKYRDDLGEPPKADRLLPTPTVMDGHNSRRASCVRHKEWASNDGTTLLDYVDPTNGGRLLPTPTTQDSANNGGPSQAERNSPPLNAVAGGALHPEFVEWVQGFPIGWTEVPDAT